MAIAEPPSRAGSGLQIIRKDRWMPAEVEKAIRHWRPETELGAIANRIITGAYGIPDEERRELFLAVRKAVIVESSLALTTFRSPTSEFCARINPEWRQELRNRGVRFSPDGTIEYHGVVGKRVVTDTGVALIVDTFDNTAATGDARYHGLGEDDTPGELASDTALQAELTTSYNPNSTRATGTFSQPSANISRSVATNTVDGPAAVVEHMVFSNATVGSGVGVDRTTFGVVTLVSPDSLQTTYSLTFTSGG